MKFCFSDQNALDCAAHQLIYVNRSEWLAQAVEKPLGKLRNPVPMAIIAHTVTAPCATAVSLMKSKIDKNMLIKMNVDLKFVCSFVLIGIVQAQCA